MNDVVYRFCARCKARFPIKVSDSRQLCLHCSRHNTPRPHDEHVHDFLADLDETFYAVYGSWAVSEQGGDLEPDFNTDAFIGTFTREEKQKILKDMNYEDNL